MAFFKCSIAALAAPLASIQPLSITIRTGESSVGNWPLTVKGNGAEVIAVSQACLLLFVLRRLLEV